MTKSLYICYFGLREPLVQTQVLPYLREVHKDGVGVTLLTFEPNPDQKWTSEQVETEREKLKISGIDWHLLPYHKRPSLPATAYDVLNGVRYIRKLCRHTPFDMMHARIHIPAVMAVLVKKFSPHKPKILFDIRGFMPEEYADAGVWKQGGPLFRLAKRVENWIIRESDGFVVLTQKAREILFPGSASRVNGHELNSAGFTDALGRPVEVIPCCVDIRTRFGGEPAADADRIRQELSLEGRTVYIHVGALGGLYLTDQLVELLAAGRSIDPTTFAIFLTQSDQAEIRRKLKQKGFDDDDFFVGRVPPGEVPAYLAASDYGVSLVKSSYATQSRSPTKIPEYLAAGLPIIANSGVGDVDELITTEGVGVLIDDFTPAAFEDAINRAAALGDISEKCSRVASERFDLQSVGGMKYRRLYEKLLV